VTAEIQISDRFVTLDEIKRRSVGKAMITA
jgi:hypothetical protein